MWEAYFDSSINYCEQEKLISLFSEMPAGLESLIKKWLRLKKPSKLRNYANVLLSTLRKRTTILVKEDKLSHRESQVIELLSKGFQNKQIASQLNISENTVKFHLKNLFVKLEVSNRLEAITKFTS
ncbi:MAG: LuxR C-terminal-related transcriptional regulator [Enterobacterales bacterium]|nr:LuxR C-terminal-related transcriptional regulator [Enterobacterales bacterium]